MIYKGYYIEELPDFKYNVYRDYDAWRSSKEPLFSCRSTYEAENWVNKAMGLPELAEYPPQEKLREQLYYLAPSTVSGIWESDWDIAEFERLHPDLRYLLLSRQLPPFCTRLNYHRRLLPLYHN